MIDLVCNQVPILCFLMISLLHEYSVSRGNQGAVGQPHQCSAQSQILKWQCVTIILTLGDGGKCFIACQPHLISDSRPTRSPASEDKVD